MLPDAAAVVSLLAGRPARLPLHGKRRLRWLGALERAIASDARRTVEQMAAEGWDGADALEAYRAWLVEVVDSAITEAKEQGG